MEDLPEARLEARPPTEPGPKMARPADRLPENPHPMEHPRLTDLLPASRPQTDLPPGDRVDSYTRYPKPIS
jgi:hypothetical protein